MTRRPGMAGFTLIELLVAITITVGLSAAMLLVTTSTLNIWRRTQDRANAGVQASLVFDYVARDLQAAILRNDGRASLAVDVLNSASELSNHGWLVTPAIKPATNDSLRVMGLSEGTTPATIASARFGVSGAWLRFITTNCETDGSLAVAVSYQLVRRPLSGAIAANNPAAIRYTLFRSAVANDTTFVAGTDVLAGAYSSGSLNPSTQRSAPTLTNPNTTSDVIATNVVDFGIWLHRRDGVALQRVFPSSSGDQSHVVNDAATAPQVADVMLRILSEEGAKQLSAIESRATTMRPPTFATDAEWWWDVVQANSQVFVRRVEIFATSL